MLHSGNMTNRNNLIMLFYLHLTKFRYFLCISGLTVHSVQVIDAFVQNIPCKMTAAEIVLYHWHNMYTNKHFDVPFNLKELKNMLIDIGRLDIVNGLPRRAVAGLDDEHLCTV